MLGLRSEEGLIKAASLAASHIQSADSAHIVAHIDADGISAAAIASAALARHGVEHRVTFFKKLDEAAIMQINRLEEEIVWIVDLGSGYLSRFHRDGLVICDHHSIDCDWLQGQTHLHSFHNMYHVNPHEYGVDGSEEISAAGVTYLVAKEMDPANIEWAHLAIIGAAGDFQDTNGSVRGMNRRILTDAVVEGSIMVENDLRLFGRMTRPLPQLLQYCNDPSLPGLTGNSPACVRFFEDLGVPLRDGNHRRTWVDLREEERQRVSEALLNLIRRSGNDAETFYGEVYTLLKEREGTELRDAKEYATLLNSCGRYDDAELGMKICLRDPKALEDAKKNRNEHRRNLSQAISLIKERGLVKERGWIQFFHSGGEIKETIVGIVAGMLLGSDDIRKDIPLIAFADTDEGEVKVSARGHRGMVSRGLNLSKAVTIAAELVGGYGGGHDIAAGATIPAGTEERFLDIVEDIIASQLV